MLKFRGKPTEYSLKARMMHWVGYKLPFDRHDWIVDRCGKQVRYIIDFYEGKRQSENDLPSIYIDARPALTLGGITDRFRMMWKSYFGTNTQKPNNPT